MTDVDRDLLAVLNSSRCRLRADVASSSLARQCVLWGSVQVGAWAIFVSAVAWWTVRGRWLR